MANVTDGFTEIKYACYAKAEFHERSVIYHR